MAALPPEAGPSRAPPQKPERTAKGVDRGQGLSSLKRIAHVVSHGRHFVSGTQRGAHRVVDYVDNSKNLVRDWRS